MVLYVYPLWSIEMIVVLSCHVSLAAFIRPLLIRGLLSSVVDVHRLKQDLNWDTLVYYFDQLLQKLEHFLLYPRCHAKDETCI